MVTDAFNKLMAIRGGFTKINVRETIKGLNPTQLNELQGMILSQAEKEKVTTQATIDRIMGAAAHDHAFGKLPPHMEDFYDNEVRAENRGNTQSIKDLDKLIFLIHQATMS